MECYLVSNSTDLKVIGHYIQCKGIPEGFKYNEFFEQPNSMTLLSNDDYPSLEPNLIFELEKKAKLTDVISTSNISAKGLLVSRKTKDLFSHFKLAEHKFYPAIVIKNNCEHEYYWLHFHRKKSDFNGVDFEKSIIYTSKNGLFRIEYVNPKSLKEFLDLNSVTEVYFEKICLDLSFAQKSGDLFFLPVPRELFASEELKLIFEENRISGLSFSSKLNKWLRN